MEEIIMKGFRKAAVLSLSASLVLTSLAGCSKKETFDAEAAAVTVNGDTISAGVINFAVRYDQSLYESLYMSFGLSDPFSQDLYGSGSTLGDDLKDMIVTDMKEALLAEQKMDEYEVSLTDEDQEKITAAATAFIEANDEEVLEHIGATQEIVERYLELTVIKNKMETAMGADVDTEVSDEEAAQRSVQYVLFTPETEEETEESTEEENADETESETEEASETEAESEAATEKSSETETEAETAVLTEKDADKTQSASETETEVVTEAVTEAGSEEAAEASTDEDTTEAASEAAETEEETETETEDPETAAAKERARVHAEEMISRVEAGEDFETVAEDMGKTASSTTFGSDYSITELVEATDGLEDGTLVLTPVETSSGYYVVYLVSQLDRDATDSEKESIVEERRSELVSSLYEEWEEDGEVSIDDEVLATITFEYHLTAPEETETEAAETEATETEAAESETAESEAGETEAAESEMAETDAESETVETEAAETESETE
jgi:hypothetical protein